MTVQELLNGVIYAGALAGALVAILGFLHFALVRPMRGFLRKEIVGSLVDIKDAIELSTSAMETLERRLQEHVAMRHFYYEELL